MVYLGNEFFFFFDLYNFGEEGEAEEIVVKYNKFLRQAVM